MKTHRFIVPFLALLLVTTNHTKAITRDEAELIGAIVQSAIGRPFTQDDVAFVRDVVQSTPGAITRDDAAIVMTAEQLQSPLLEVWVRQQLEDLLNTLLSGGTMRRGPGIDPSLEQKRQELELERQHPPAPPAAEPPIPAAPPQATDLASPPPGAREEAAQAKIIALLEHPGVSAEDKNLLFRALQNFLGGHTLTVDAAGALDAQLTAMGLDADEALAPQPPSLTPEEPRAPEQPAPTLPSAPPSPMVSRPASPSDWEPGGEASVAIDERPGRVGPTHAQQLEDEARQQELAARRAQEERDAQVALALAREAGMTPRKVNPAPLAQLLNQLQNLGFELRGRKNEEWCWEAIEQLKLIHERYDEVNRTIREQMALGAQLPAQDLHYMQWLTQVIQLLEAIIEECETLHILRRIR